MRIKPWYMLLLILILAGAATWVDLPGQTADPFGLKKGITIHEGLDLQGGLQVVLQAHPPAGVTVNNDALLGTRDTIARRVNGLGVSEPLIQTRGSDQIIVELPGVKDPENAVKILQQTALLEFIDPQGQFLPEGTVVNTSLGPATDAEAATASPSPAASESPAPSASPAASPAASGPTYTTIVTGADLEDAYPATDNVGALVVGFKFKPDPGKKLQEFTRQNIGRPLSIVVDKKVINTARIQDAFGPTGQITGMSADEVNALVLQLKSGALAVPLEVVQSRTVGPTLGSDSIDKSLIAGIVGLSVVALFMILYYRFPGVLAVVALLIYTALVFALFKLIPVVLTVAGITAFILSIGMAVDANVLIFSRMKEELRLGHNIRRSIEAGFDHAWPSIRDSNISTMITAVILYWFGKYTGASIIQGFALTLFVGVAISMFTAITVTRTLLRVFLTSSIFHNRWWYGIESESTSPAQSSSTSIGTAD
ncbi:protein translocase subunit SecD [Nitrolancea hollandica]|uniref:Protein translocase subunit SecD n=1 Tax=Nitrolancea hollandica Lb TaxID=1129897 RepID=I4ENK1_9BACT|nr:protein translocase subunit SecD [Nitrolancea hollandica]CCF86264.1 Protein-export membrane protein secD [Nitrolancea hollandica Lb]